MACLHSVYPASSLCFPLRAPAKPVGGSPLIGPRDPQPLRGYGRGRGEGGNEDGDGIRARDGGDDAREDGDGYAQL